MSHDTDRLKLIQEIYDQQVIIIELRNYIVYSYATMINNRDLRMKNAIRHHLTVIFSILCLASCNQNQGAGVTSSEASSEAAEKAKQTQASTRKKPLHMVLGTGSVQGVYFPIGGVICRLLNRGTELHRMRCSLESTGGSIYNLRQLRADNFDLVFAQSDWQYHAYNGSSTFTDEGANEDLRAVFALEADPLALIVKDESDIRSFEDLQNRIVSFGYKRSLQHRIVDDLLAAKSWNDSNFKSVERMSDTKQISAICSDAVEAILLLSSSLNDHLSGLSDDCKLRLVPIESAEIKAIIEAKPFYRVGKIPKGLYLNASKATKSFGLGATFVADQNTSPKAIYHVVKEVVENFKDFKSLHPSLIGLDKRELPYAGISIPLHPGAVRYYKEARLLK